MKKILLLLLISVFFIPTTVNAVSKEEVCIKLYTKKNSTTGEDEISDADKTACATTNDYASLLCPKMGYEILVTDCIKKGGNPLLCPYSSTDISSNNGTEVDNNDYCVCLQDSCQGYPLYKDSECQENEYKYLRTETAPNGENITAIEKVKINSEYIGTIEGTGGQSVKDIESCNVSSIDNAFTYYRINSCASDKRFDGVACIESCDITKYPFLGMPPATSNGIIGNCMDHNGAHYGYVECYEGWIASNGTSTPTDGQCHLGTCSISDFPYIENPDKEEKRGTLGKCRIGGNTYYRYKDCKDGYTMKRPEPNKTEKGGVCIKDCTFSCSGASCNMTDTDCKIGDRAVVKDIDAGTGVGI